MVGTMKRARVALTEQEMRRLMALCAAIEPQAHGYHLHKRLICRLSAHEQRIGRRRVAQGLPERSAHGLPPLCVALKLDDWQILRTLTAMRLQDRNLHNTCRYAAQTAEECN